MSNKNNKKLHEQLTYNQFKFCEAYLRYYNVEKACREAYPNMHSRNGSNVIKSRKVIAYIKERLDQKKATLIRLTDKMHDKLFSLMDSRDNMTVIEAAKLVMRLNEIEARFKELDNLKNNENNLSININYERHEDA